MCFQINEELHCLNDKYEDLQISIAETDNVTREISRIEENLEDRVTTLEEEVLQLRTQNNMLRDYLNLTIKELNAVIDLLNIKNTV